MDFFVIAGIVLVAVVLVAAWFDFRRRRRLDTSSGRSMGEARWAQRTDDKERRMKWGGN